MKNDLAPKFRYIEYFQAAHPYYVLYLKTGDILTAWIYTIVAPSVLREKINQLLT